MIWLVRQSLSSGRQFFPLNRPSPPLRKISLQTVNMDHGRGHTDHTFTHIHICTLSMQDSVKVLCGPGNDEFDQNRAWK